MGINAEPYIKNPAAENANRKSGKADSGTAKDNRPGDVGGDHVRKAEKWGGGSKASKGHVTKADKQNPNSSARS
jgi:hypothetical protein